MPNVRLRHHAPPYGAYRRCAARSTPCGPQRAPHPALGNAGDGPEGLARCSALRPTRPHAGRLGRGWPRPAAASGTSLPASRSEITVKMKAITSQPLLNTSGAKLPDMHALKARVENGRIKLDEPTDLPEGKLVELVPLDEVFLGGGDDLDEEERKALHRELEASMAEAKAGELVDFDTVLAELRSPS